MDEALAAGGGPQLAERDAGRAKRLANRLSILDQHGWLTLEQARGERPDRGRTGEDLVDQEESRCAKQRSGHRQIVADDPVLNGVGHEQQDDQVESVGLTQLTPVSYTHLTLPTK